MAGPDDSGRALVSVDAPPPVAGLDASAFDVRLLRSLEVLTGALAWVEEHHRDVPIAYFSRRMNRVLVPGGAGTIGAAVARRLPPAATIRSAPGRASGRWPSTASSPQARKVLRDAGNPRLIP